MTVDNMRQALQCWCADQNCENCVLRDEVACTDTHSDEVIIENYNKVFGNDTPLMSAPKSEAVAHPSHYNFSKYEPVYVIREWQLNFNLGNVIKYVARAGRKDNIIQDLKKARQYLDFEIQALEKEQTANAKVI